MIDDLLGRTQLKERIEELEGERDSLEAQLEAENGRRADAVAAKQDAEERINRLQDRIADLEGQPEVPAERSEIGFRHEETVRGARAESVISRLESVKSEPEGILTAYVDGSVPDQLRELLGDRVSLVSRAAPCLICADDAGIVSVASRPPVAPEPFCEWGATPRLERSWFRPTGRFALALIRSDTFAIGVYQGSERVSYEGFRSEIKSDHSKGGFSQSRFERLRDEQIEEHVEKSEAVLETVDAERLYVVGDQRLIGMFDADVSAAVDATGKPESALNDAFDDFWSFSIYGL